MSNKLRGEQSVEVAGVSYVLRPTMQALCAIEGAVDFGVLELMRRLGTGDVRVSHMAVVLKEASRAGGKEIPQADIGEFVTRRFGDAASLVVKLLSGAFGEPEEAGNVQATPQG